MYSPKRRPRRGSGSCPAGGTWITMVPSLPQNDVSSGYSVPHCGQRRLTGAMLLDRSADRKSCAQDGASSPFPHPAIQAVRQRQLFAMLGANEEHVASLGALAFAEATQDRQDLGSNAA